MEYQIETLHRAGLREICLVTGYRGDRLAPLGFPRYHNPDFARTNMVASLMAAAPLFDGSSDLLVAYSDIVYEPCVVRALLASSDPMATTVDLEWRKLWRLRMSDPLADAETMKMDPAGRIVELGRKPSSDREIQGQYMGLTKIRADRAPGVLEAWRRLRPNRPFPDPRRIAMTDFLQYLIDHRMPLRAATVRGGWLEVDSLKDLERYEGLRRTGLLADFWRPGGRI